MYTSMAIEIHNVIKVLLTELAKIEAEEPRDPNAILSDLNKRDLLYQIELLHTIQLALLRQNTRRAVQFFHQLDTDVRNVVSTDAETFADYVLADHA